MQGEHDVCVHVTNQLTKLTKVNGYSHSDACTEDWVEIWNIIDEAEDRLVGRYCGHTAPGPIESHLQAKALKIMLHTDEEYVYSGFKARYIFFTAKSIFGGKLVCTILTNL